MFLDDPAFAGRIREWLKTLAQEERLGRVRDAVAGRRPALDHRAGDRRELCQPHLPAQSAGRRAAAAQRSTRASASTIARSPSSPTRSRSATTTTSRGSAIGCSISDLGPVALAFAGTSTPDDQRAIDRVLAGAPARRTSPPAWLRERGLGLGGRLVAPACICHRRTDHEDSRIGALRIGRFAAGGIAGAGAIAVIDASNFVENTLTAARTSGGDQQSAPAAAERSDRCWSTRHAI